MVKLYSFLFSQMHEVQERNGEEVEEDYEDQPRLFLVIRHLCLRVESMDRVDIHNDHDDDTRYVN